MHELASSIAAARELASSETPYRNGMRLPPLSVDIYSALRFVLFAPTFLFLSPVSHRSGGCGDGLYCVPLDRVCGRCPLWKNWLRASFTAGDLHRRGQALLRLSFATGERSSTCVSSWWSENDDIDMLGHACHASCIICALRWWTA